MFFLNHSGDLLQPNECTSHVSVYYEQNQENEEVIEKPVANECSSSETEIPLNPPIEIHAELTVSIDLPPLIWHGYENFPKILTVTNTGRTILITGQWPNNRPYIEGGPLNGNYLFSQIHFHCPSEHEIDGQRYPLEMHVVHYKTSYLTQERAVQKEDGTVVLVYLFRLVDANSTPISCITKLAAQLEKVNNRTETKEITLTEIIKPFASNYYVYWSSVPTKRKSYMLQWIISANDLYVTKQEVEDLSNIISYAGLCGDWQSAKIMPQDNAIFRVGEDDYCMPELEFAPPAPPAPPAASACKTCTHQEVSVQASVCSCQSKPCQSHWQIHTYRCYKCDPSANTCKGTRHSEKEMAASRHCKQMSKCLKAKKMCCEVVEGADGKQRLNCKCGKACEKGSKKWRKKNKKKSKSKKGKGCSSDSETPCTSAGESTSKSSVDHEEKKEDEGINDEAPEDKPSSIRFKIDEKEKRRERHHKKRKKKTETITVNNLEEVHGSQSSNFTNAVEACDISLSTSNLLSSAVQLSDKWTQVKSKKSNTHEEESKTKTSEIDFDTNTASAAVEEQAAETAEPIPPERKATSRSLQFCATSYTNVQSSEPELAPSLMERVSKSKSLCETNSKKKDPEKTESEHQDFVQPEATESLCDDSRSGNDNNERETDDHVSQSLQEVKCLETKSKTETQKSELTLPEEEKKTSSVKLGGKKSSKGVFKKNASEAAKAKTAATTSSEKESKTENKNEVTTLFEKKKSRKKEKPLALHGSELQVNFLLTPTNTPSRSLHSCALKTSDSDYELDKEVSEVHEDEQVFPQDFAANTALTKPDFLLKESKVRSQVCLFMEHLFRSENNERKVLGCTSQEYNVAIMCDQCVLQEYKGKFHPQQLELGNYEPLSLIPKYPELENSNIKLCDCTVMKETFDQICIRVKFLLSEAPTTLSAEPNKENKPEDPDSDLKPLVDEETQYNSNEFYLTNQSRFVLKNEEPVDENKTKQEGTNVADCSPKSAEGEKTAPKNNANEEKGRTEMQECKVVIKKNARDRSKKATEPAGSKGSKANKSGSESADKKSKPSLAKRRNTVYFLYDKVEKDENSGKKVFVGSFKTRNEKDNVKKQKKVVPEKESANVKETERSNGQHLLPVPNKVVDAERLKAKESSKVREASPERRALAARKDDAADRKADVVTLHKYKPKHSEMNRFKKECKNVLIGKVVKDLNKDENFKGLAAIIGVEKEKNPKVSIYELQEEVEAPQKNEKTNGESANSENKSKAKNAVVAKEQGACSKSEVNVQKKPKAAEKGLAANKSQKSPDKKDSQAALILIPVEVESLSKIEVILIEHSNDAKKDSKGAGHSPLPNSNE